MRVFSSISPCFSAHLPARPATHPPVSARGDISLGLPDPPAPSSRAALAIYASTYFPVVAPRHPSPGESRPGPASDLPPKERAKPESIRVLLVDDHVLVRAGVRALLEEKQGFEVVGEARDGIEALDLLATLRPSVVVMDLIMPGLSGLETTRQIRERHPEIEVVILSMYGDEEQILQALQGGARGYVRKGSDVDRLVAAVREAAAGRYDYSDVIGAERLQEFLARPRTVGRYDTLTRREREILHLAAWGYTSQQIASRLQISPRTVETHRAHLLRKLGLRNQVDLVFFAIRHGVLTPDSAEAVRARERLAN